MSSKDAMQADEPNSDMWLEDDDEDSKAMKEAEPSSKASAHRAGKNAHGRKHDDGNAAKRQKKEPFNDFVEKRGPTEPIGGNRDKRTKKTGKPEDRDVWTRIPDRRAEDSHYQAKPAFEARPSDSHRDGLRHDRRAGDPDHGNDYQPKRSHQPHAAAHMQPHGSSHQGKQPAGLAQPQTHAATKPSPQHPAATHRPADLSHAVGKSGSEASGKHSLTHHKSDHANPKPYDHFSKAQAPKIGTKHAQPEPAPQPATKPGQLLRPESFVSGGKHGQAQGKQEQGHYDSQASYRQAQHGTASHGFERGAQAEKQTHGSFGQHGKHHAKQQYQDSYYGYDQSSHSDAYQASYQTADDYGYSDKYHHSDYYEDSYRQDSHQPQTKSRHPQDSARRDQAHQDHGYYKAAGSHAAHDPHFHQEPVKLLGKPDHKEPRQFPHGPQTRQAQTYATGFGHQDRHDHYKHLHPDEMKAYDYRAAPTDHFPAKTQPDSNKKQDYLTKETADPLKAFDPPAFPGKFVQPEAAKAVQSKQQLGPVKVIEESQPTRSKLTTNSLKKPLDLPQAQAAKKGLKADAYCFPDPAAKLGLAPQNVYNREGDSKQSTNNISNNTFQQTIVINSPDAPKPQPQPQQGTVPIQNMTYMPAQFPGQPSQMSYVSPAFSGYTTPVGVNVTPYPQMNSFATATHPLVSPAQSQVFAPMVNSYPQQVLPQFAPGLQGYGGYGQNLSLQSGGGFGYGMGQPMQPFALGGPGFEGEGEEEEEEEEDAGNDGLVRMFEMMKAMFPQMANLHTDHNEQDLQAFEDDEKNGNFVDSSRDCPCCKGFVFNCPTEICKRLGSCHCVLRRENEGAGPASQA